MAATLPVFAAVMGCCGWGNNGNVIVGSGPQNDALWVANGTNVVEFSPSQLESTNTDPAPQVTLSSAAFGAVKGVTFDGRGDLWVIDSGTVSTGGTVAPALYEFTISQLAKLSTTSNPAPAVTIQSSSFVTPEEAAFDGFGDLLVTDSGGNAVYVFTPSQLSATSTTAIPASTITSSTAFNGPVGIAFDGPGDLYVANNGGNTIYGFNASSLPNLNGTSGGSSSSSSIASIALTPAVMLTNSGASIQSPWGLAFDGRGNLWSSNAGAAGTLVEFTRSQIATSGAPTPNITFSSVAVNSNQTLVAPEGVALDGYDDLATASSGAPFGITGFAESQLVTGSTTGITPDVFLIGSSTTLSAPAGVAFGPTIQ